MLRRAAGFSLVELLVTAAILAILATVALPMAEVAVQRTHEEQLRSALREIREAINAYKKAYDTGHITKVVGASGYPPTLNVLVAGVVDAADARGGRLRFLRRIPRDPFFLDTQVPAEQSWGKRSYASEADAPQEGADVYDIYSLSTVDGLNGVPYRQW